MADFNIERKVSVNYNLSEREMISLRHATEILGDIEVSMTRTKEDEMALVVANTIVLIQNIIDNDPVF